MDKLIQNNLKAWLIDYFEQGVSNEKRVGVEIETFGVLYQTGQAISYEGKKGIKEIFAVFCNHFGWTPIIEDDHVIALKRGKSEIHLEPGGQLEYCSSPQRDLKVLKKELQIHLSELFYVGEKMGLKWLQIGYHPFSAVGNIPWVPKNRYRIMRDYLPTRGPLAHQMMKKTASLQANFDYSSMDDAFIKLRLALALSPIIASCFHNSPISEGHISGLLGLRTRAWSRTDPDRCGLVRSWIEDPCLESFMQHLLHIPMIFLVRDGKWLPVFGKPFGVFLREGYEQYRAERADLKLFMNAIFTESRLKPFIEVRCMDRNNLDLSIAFVALWKGLFYDSLAYENAWELVKNWDWQLRLMAYEKSPVNALDLKVGSRSVRDYVKDLVQIAQEGLKRQSMVLAGLEHVNQRGEKEFLNPLKEIVLEDGFCPARRLISLWNESWGKCPKKLIDEVAIQDIGAFSYQ